MVDEIFYYWVKILIMGESGLTSGYTKLSTLKITLPMSFFNESLHELIPGSYSNEMAE